MKPRHTALAALLVGAVLLILAPTQARADGPDLSRLDLGSHTTGPDISLRDLRGRVVIVEYWGITCPPCIKSIPHTTELAEKYGHDKLVIIANQVWNASDRQTKDVWEQHAKSDFVAVINGGSMPGFQPRGVPSAVMFDHEGNKIWEGHPASMDNPLAAAIANLPERVEVEEEEAAGEEAQGPAPIVTELTPQHFRREVQQINEQKRSMSSTLARLRQAAERSSRQEQVDEANAVLAAVSTWAQAKQSEAQQALASDPATAYAIAEQTSMLLGRDELAAGVNEIKKQIEADSELMATVRSTNMLRNVMAMASSISLTDDPAAASDRANSRTVRMIARDLKRIISTWPDSEAGKQAVELLEQWGLEG